MRCLTYALWKHIREGGYLCIRKSKNLPFLPHFLHATKLEECTHVTATGPTKGFWRELWETLAGKGYGLKEGDE